MSATRESITSDTTNATKSSTSKSESKEKEKTAAEQIHSTVKKSYKIAITRRSKTPYEICTRLDVQDRDEK